MKLLIFACVIIFSNTIFGQEIPWAKTHDWTLYVVKSQKVFEFTVDSLRKYRNIKLNDDSVHNFIVEISSMTKERQPVWMGAFAATYQLDDTSLHKIIISQYGGFFFDPEGGRFYLLKRDNRSKWLDYISRLYAPPQ